MSQAPAPDHLIDSGVPSEALLAHVAVSKYADGLPLYRQEGIYARDGVEISRNSMANWMGHVGFHLAPLADRILALIKEGERVYADETTLPTLSPGSGKTKTAWLWTYARDDRTFGGTAPPMVAYRFEDSRGGDCVERHLAGYAGLLQVDGWGAYNRLAEAKRARRAADARGVLGASETQVLRIARGRRLARGERNRRADGQAVEDRGKNPRPGSRSSAAPRGRNDPPRSSPTSGHSGKRNWPAFPASRNLPRRSAMPRAGARLSNASCMTAASISTATPSSARSARKRSPARMPCSPDPTKARHTAHLVMPLIDGVDFVGAHQAPGVAIAGCRLGGGLPRVQGRHGG